MSDEIVCPNCGKDDHLRGEPQGKLIRITCSECALVWDRDPAPSCPQCASKGVRLVPQSVWEKSRGTQLSTVSIRMIYLCPDCDHHRLQRFLDSWTPLPPDENPAG
ncbi:MAG: hypothetical protein ACR2H3_11275 [Acidimicrobiales bacterium]